MKKLNLKNILFIFSYFKHFYINPKKFFPADVHKILKIFCIPAKNSFETLFWVEHMLLMYVFDICSAIFPTFYIIEHICMLAVSK